MWECESNHHCDGSPPGRNAPLPRQFPIAYALEPWPHTLDKSKHSHKFATRQRMLCRVHLITKQPLRYLSRNACTGLNDGTLLVVLGTVLNPLQGAFASRQTRPCIYPFAVSGHRSVPIVAMVFYRRGGEDFAIYQGGQFLTRLGLLPLTHFCCYCQIKSLIPIQLGRVFFI